ncbi:MAG: 3-deoxy-manno-octulosonate cytidylyltransferase [Bacteroidales bacterium]|nr:3-deoxy-manno-octulosonate cytidylyltransferase [Bacteroidales bacterium]MBN2757046.1 3-deoxy-manno-octulosonate cytidylyltransferase [Bacteroidales bacterium]
MKVLGIIPARWASTRFPGKPLIKIGEKTMIQRVYEQTAKVLDNVVVATDDQRIIDEVKRFNGQVVITSDKHQSGTDRCAEALEIYQKNVNETFDIVVNIQGDEPFIQPEQIQQVVDCFDENTQIATLIKKITDEESLFNVNNPKVVLNNRSEALYFSRATIPYVMKEKKEDWLKKYTYYEHLGLYGYKSSILRELTNLKQAPLELSESLEQNRWLENGYKIKVAETEFENISIDTQEDLENIIKKGLV